MVSGVMTKVRCDRGGVSTKGSVPKVRLRMDFTLDERLAADTVPVCRLPLSHVLLMRDSNYPWLILVPERAGLIELTDLDGPDAAQLMTEIRLAERVMAARFRPTKLNVAALGNMVPQLHVHVIVRQTGDPAWPKPVWGVVPARPYEPGLVEGLAAEIAELMARHRL